MYTITEQISEASQILEAAGVDDPRREASSLITFAINKDKTFLYAHPEYELSEAEQRQFLSIIQRRAGREPFHYIIGRKEFYGLDFEVTPDVLIPRPETEMLVREAIEILRKTENPTFCEIGLGSGCISISVLHNVRSAIAVGLEISRGAIDVARKNTVEHDFSDRLSIMHSDVYSALESENFDLIVANPPYIPAEDMRDLQPEVREFEPHQALTDGGEGYSVIKRIIDGAPQYLNASGVLLIEIGKGQAESVKSMFDMEIWRSIDIISDFQAIPRMVCATTN